MERRVRQELNTKVMQVKSTDELIVLTLDLERASKCPPQERAASTSVANVVFGYGEGTRLFKLHYQ